MNLSAIHKALRHVAGWGIVIFFVGLLTVIFSFLGSFFCAGLVGMMVGSVRFSKTQTVALSCVAPAVLYGILAYGRTQLLPRQVALLAGLSLAIFWATYVTVRWLVWYEHKSRPAGAPAGAVSHNGQARPSINSPAPWGDLSLEVLQGKWFCGAPDQKNSPDKLMIISEQSLHVTVRDSFGNVSFLGKGHLSLHPHREGRSVAISAGTSESPGDTLVCI